VRKAWRKTVLNLHDAGVLPDVIAMQLDTSKEQVIGIIRERTIQNERQKTTIKEAADESSLGMFYLDAVVNIDSIIKSSQMEMWKSLNGEMEFNISTEDSQDVLAKAAGSKVTFVILYVDIVGSTKLSMTLPVEKMAAIVRAFTHEMSVIVSAYGGYVLKYLGDAILAFFAVSDKSDLYIPCINAVHCGRSMIRAVEDGFNPLLDQEGYPDLGVRVGIDVGEVVVVQYGWNIQSSIVDGKRQTIARKAHHDILGYTISIASKITGLADPNQLVIGRYVYDALDREQKNTFKMLNVPSELWSYVSGKTGKPYKVYARLT
jgi:adenylate cyclase